jgi:Holliday junction resolvasome RuvABC endonuclease subunit
MGKSIKKNPDLVFRRRQVNDGKFRIHRDYELKAEGSPRLGSVAPETKLHVVPSSGLSFLTLDLGTATGWAARDEKGFVFSGVQTFPLNRGESVGMRFLRFRGWLVKMFQDTKANVIAYEQAIPFHKSACSGELAHGFAAILQAECADRGLECLIVTPPELKKFATGKGNSKKDEMLAAARVVFPDITVLDDNHADALHLLRFAVGLLKRG